MLFSQEQKKMILLTSLGGALEFYDFIIFVFFAKILGELFFPSSNSMVSLIASWSLFAVGYLMRPLGGIILGSLGDRVGRKKTFLITLIGMAVPSLVIGLLPSYQTIGLLAPILLILFRLLQGFSVGGEVPGALVFITELTPTKNRALVCSLIFLGVNSGLMLGSLIATVLGHLMTAQNLMLWGWRIPFCVGGVLGILGFYLRRQLHETPLFLKLQREKKQSHFPLKEVFSQYLPEIGQGALLTAFGAVIVSLCFLFMPTYLSTFFNYSYDKLMILNTVLILVFSIVPIFVGYCADKYGYLKILRLGTVGLLLLSYPLYTLFASNDFLNVIIASVILTALGNLVISVFTSLLVALYPTPVRYTGVAFVYNLGFAIAGGFTPLVLTWLIHTSGNRLVPGLYLTLFAGIALLISFFVRETRGIALNKI